MKDRKKQEDTPLMRQYAEMKSQYPETIMFMRVGDFYETFGEDAVITSKVLGIVLTRRASGNNNSTELAGVPHHALDAYLPKLVKAGYKVAVCDQLEDPKLTKKIVKRGVTELVTPGVSYNDNILNSRENNYLASCYFYKDRAGVAFLDISTGIFKIAEGTLEYIDILINDFNPKEVLLERGYAQGFRERFSRDIYISQLDGWTFVYESAHRRLLKLFNLETLKGFGIDQMLLGISAAGAIIHYLDMTEHHNLDHISSISRIDRDKFVWMDKFTIRNLEIFSSLSSKEGKCLMDVIDKCSSAMGARLLRSWVAMPLNSIDEINSRLDVVESIYNNIELLDGIRERISAMADLERIISRTAAGRVTPREVLSLGVSLNRITSLIEICENDQALQHIVSNLNRDESIADKISKTISEDASNGIGKGPVIADGVDSRLDDYRNIMNNGKDILLEIQQRERDTTGISSLKIGYNNVFGYYLEVRNTHSEKVPEHWIRKQTLVNAERYITPELKEYEQKILQAQDAVNAIEAEIYNSLILYLQSVVPTIQRSALAVAQLDVLSNFAYIAKENNYNRAVVDDSDIIEINQGRHPVIESMFAPGESYVANDLYIDTKLQQIIILTGPNMAGKSALLRQTALIVLMAQIGSFVPAKWARIGYIDKLFTRVGASDNISKGESTFMVEMLESATILNNLSARSLVLLDEIGRGTSTYDGMSIAWAMVEYLTKNPHPKTLFATHYHELNELANHYPTVKNYHIATKEIDGNIVFLRKLTPGGVASSFGIHVARLAGMPREVIASAEAKLRRLTQDSEQQKQNTRALREESVAPVQLSLYQLDDPLLLDIKSIIEGIDLDSTSPLEAFDTIRSIKQKLSGGQKRANSKRT